MKMNKIAAGLIAGVAALGLMVPTMASAYYTPYIPVEDAVPYIPTVDIPDVPAAPEIPVIPDVPAIPVTGNVSYLVHGDVPVTISFSGIDGKAVTSETVYVYGRRYTGCYNGNLTTGREELLINFSVLENRNMNAVIGADIDMDSVRVVFDYAGKNHTAFQQVVWIADTLNAYANPDDISKLRISMYKVNGVKGTPTATLQTLTSCDYGYTDYRGRWCQDTSVKYVNNG